MKKTIITAALAAAMVPMASATTNFIPEASQSFETTGPKEIALSPNTLTLTSAWTLQFDAVITETNGKQWCNLVRIGHDGGSDEFITLWFNTQNQTVGFSATEYHIKAAGTATNASFNVLDGNSHTYTLVYTGTYTPTISLYIDDAETASATCDFTITDYKSGDVTSLASTWPLNYLQFTGQNITGAKISNVSLVPEPATATLSLLALAGLAARRRRK